MKHNQAYSDEKGAWDIAFSYMNFDADDTNDLGDANDIFSLLMLIETSLTQGVAPLLVGIIFILSTFCIASYLHVLGISLYLSMLMLLLFHCEGERHLVAR